MCTDGLRTDKSGEQAAGWLAGRQAGLLAADTLLIVGRELLHESIHYIFFVFVVVDVDLLARLGLDGWLAGWHKEKKGRRRLKTDGRNSSFHSHLMLLLLSVPKRGGSGSTGCLPPRKWLRLLLPMYACAGRESSPSPTPSNVIPSQYRRNWNIYVCVCLLLHMKGPTRPFVLRELQAHAQYIHIPQTRHSLFLFTWASCLPACLLAFFYWVGLHFFSLSFLPLSALNLTCQSSSLFSSCLDCSASEAFV